MVIFENQYFKVEQEGDRKVTFSFPDQVIFRKSFFLEFDVPIEFTLVDAQLTAATLLLPVFARHFGQEEALKQTTILENEKAFSYMKQYHDITKPDDNYLDEKITTPSKPALFFGGGKDSLLALNILRSIYPADQITIFRLVFERREDSLSKKRELFDYNFGQEFWGKNRVIRCTTSYFSSLNNTADSRLTHTGLYVGCFGTLLRQLKIDQISYGLDAAEFYGRIHYRRGRPEILNLLSKAVSSFYQQPLGIKNYNFAFTPFVAFHTLIKNFPTTLEKIRMCEKSTTEPWCYECRKCFHFALFNMASSSLSKQNAVDDNRVDFNFPKVFEGKFFNDLLHSVESKASVDTRRFPIDQPLLAADRHAWAIIETMKTISPNAIKEYLGKSPKAVENFNKLKNYYTNKFELDTSEHGMFWESAYNYEIANNGILPPSNEKSVIFQLIQNAGISVLDKKEVLSSVKGRQVSYQF